ncbi:MAG: uncharacterized protein QOJ29_4999 [Thermoleophilaceae bacterium]|jgi:DUF917 family protein|nr:uncharacterized protein [Thermoleophilaceae bacterium]
MLDRPPRVSDLFERLDASNLPAVARGCALLGAGRGGDTDLALLMALLAVEENGPVPVVELGDLSDDGLVMPCGSIGSPTVATERLWSGDEGFVLRDTVETVRAGSVHALMCFNVGGPTGVLPVVWAARLGLPLVNGDGMGRALSGVQRQTMHLAGIKAGPVVLTDGRGNTLVLDPADDDWAERLARGVAATLGGVCAGALFTMTVAEARGAVIEGSISRAFELGEQLGLPGANGGAVLISGKVVDVERRAEEGPVHGSATVAGEGEYEGRHLRLELQNEFLLALEDGVLRAAVPDVISVLALATGDPVATEELAYGERVAVVALPGPDVWRSEAGLAVAGPRAFGYDVDYAEIAVEASDGAR